MPRITSNDVWRFNMWWDLYIVLNISFPIFIHLQDGILDIFLDFWYIKKLVSEIESDLTTTFLLSHSSRHSHFKCSVPCSCPGFFHFISALIVLEKFDFTKIKFISSNNALLLRSYLTWTFADKNPTQRKGQNLTENALNYCEFSVLVKRYISPEFDLSPHLTKTLNPT